MTSEEWMNKHDDLKGELSPRAFSAAMRITDYCAIPTKKQVAHALRSGFFAIGKTRNCGKTTVSELEKWSGGKYREPPKENYRTTQRCINYLRKYGHRASY